MEQFEISEGWMLVLVGGLLLAGYAAHLLGGRLHVPRVTLLILLGVVCGPYFLNIVPATMSGWFTYVAHFALAMVGFLLGEGFVGKKMKSLGWAVLTLPLTYVFCAAFLVFLATFAVEWSVVTALVLAGIAPSSAPAATVDVIRENHAAGQLAKTLLRVVAIDDAFGIVLFSLLLATAEGIVGERAATTEILLGLWEVVGALLLGVMLGLPMAWLTGRLRKGEPAILEAAGFVFLCGGLATLLDVSYLLAQRGPAGNRLYSFPRGRTHPGWPPRCKDCRRTARSAETHRLVPAAAGRSCPGSGAACSRKTPRNRRAFVTTDYCVDRRF